MHSKTRTLMQAKVNSGYAANLKDLIAADGIPAFIAPVGLGWQGVDALVDAAESGAPALVESEQHEDSAALSMLAQSATAEQSALQFTGDAPLATPGISLQVFMVVCTWWCPQHCSASVDVAVIPPCLTWEMRLMSLLMVLGQESSTRASCRSLAMRFAGHLADQAALSAERCSGGSSQP